MRDSQGSNPSTAVATQGNRGLPWVFQGAQPRAVQRCSSLHAPPAPDALHTVPHAARPRFSSSRLQRELSLQPLVPRHFSLDSMQHFQAPHLLGAIPYPPITSSIQPPTPSYLGPQPPHCCLSEHFLQQHLAWEVKMVLSLLCRPSTLAPGTHVGEAELTCTPQPSNTARLGEVIPCRDVLIGTQLAT